MRGFGFGLQAVQIVVHFKREVREANHVRLYKEPQIPLCHNGSALQAQQEHTVQETLRPELGWRRVRVKLAIVVFTCTHVWQFMTK